MLVDGSVAFDDDGTILAVGSAHEVAVEGARRVDLSGRVVAPGYVDAHVHLGEHLMRGLVPDGAGPTEWLPDWLLPAYAALTPADERLAAELAIAEMLLTGTTAFAEAGTLLDWEPAADAVEALGIRAQLGRWTWDLARNAPRLPPPSTHEALVANADLIDGVRSRDCDRLSSAVVLLGLGTASDDLLREAKVLADDRGVGTAMMWASVAPKHGGHRLPADRLEELGWLDDRTKLTHAVYLEPGDVGLLAERDVRIAHCPTAALRHAKGIARHGRIPELLAAGVRVGLGGDSANGSNHFDMHKLMGLTATLWKDYRMDTAMVPPETALEMATRDGAACLWLDGEIGSLEVGKQADLVVYSTEHPEWRPLLHPVQNLVLGATDRSIESVWVRGRKVVEQGQLLTADLPELLARADRAAADLLDRAGLRAPWNWPRR